MHVVVCLKAIPDPDAPATALQIDPVRLTASGGSTVANPFDENALELALRLTAASGGKVTVVSAGGAEANDRLRKALAAGAGAAVRLVLPEPPAGASGDAFVTAAALAAAVARLEGVQLVLAGRQAGDWDHGQVGGLLAELLGWAHVPFVFRAAADAEYPGHLLVDRETAGGQARVRVALPAVLTATNHVETMLRLPRTRDLLAARQVEIPTWDVPSLLPRTRVVSLRMASGDQKQAALLGGADSAAKAEALVDWLRQRGLVGGEARS